MEEVALVYKSPPPLTTGMKGIWNMAMRRKKKEGTRPVNISNTGLTQIMFTCIEYYFRGYSKTQSMLKAGYAKTTAETQQWRVFGREDVKQEIERRRWALRARGNNMAARIQDELAKIAFFNIGNVIRVTPEGELIYDFDDVNMDTLAAMGEITVETYKEGKGWDAIDVKRVKVKPYDKKAALDSLARIHGMFNDKLEVDTKEDLARRLQAGRNRASSGDSAQIEDGTVTDADFEEVYDE